MNEFKKKLFLLVARLSEESCQNILARIFQRIGENTLLPKEVTAVAKFSNQTWDESKHPRAEDGKFTDETYSSLITLLADLCREYDLDPLTDIIRHYDVTGKICPKYYVDHEDLWRALLTDVAAEMTD